MEKLSEKHEQTNAFMIFYVLFSWKYDLALLLKTDTLWVKLITSQTLEIRLSTNLGQECSHPMGHTDWLRDVPEPKGETMRMQNFFQH